MLFDLKQLRHKIGEKEYTFSCDPTSPISEIHEALATFTSFVVQVQREHQARMAAEAAKQAEAPKEA